MSRQIRVALALEDASSSDAFARAFAELRHEVLDADRVESADLLVTDDEAAPPTGAGERWLVAPTLSVLLRRGVPEAPDGWAGFAAVLCADPTVQGLLDAAGPHLAERTRPVWGDLPGRIGALVTRAFPEPAAAAPAGSRPLRVLVTGHALHFFTGVLDRLQRTPRLDVRVDHVPVFARHDTATSTELLAWADVVVCEWMSPVAAWYSHNKPAGTRLIVRMHAMEVFNDWPDQIDIDGVDRIVCVSPHYVRLLTERTGWPAEKVACIPNYVDCLAFDRPKLPGVQHHVGFVGMVPSGKRLDLALDVIERLRRRDPRFRLFVKTKLPWEYPWNWREEPQREATAALFDRISSSTLLRDGVVFDPYGADVAAWMRRIGHLVSTSDRESFHLSVAEAMASGAVPAVRDWPGSAQVYGERWVHDSLAAMVDAVDRAAGDDWVLFAEEAREQVRHTFDLEVVAAAFLDLILDLAPGASHAASRG